MFKLNNLKSPFGSNPAPKRKGRGIGSGNGKTAGKGHKGQLARSGGLVHPIFEGGQMGLVRKSPKVGFRTYLKNLRIDVNVGELSRWASKDVKLADLIPQAMQGKPRVIVNISGSKLPNTLPKSIEANRVAPKTLELLK